MGTITNKTEEAEIIRTISLAGQRFRYRFYFPGTAEYFKDYFRVDMPEENDEPPLYVTKEFLRRHRGMVFADSAVEYLEFFALLIFFGDRLLKSRRCIFHGTVFTCGEKTWMMSGPSGVGKTTQYKLWKKLFPDTEIINGDKPILHMPEGEPVMVHPSPWTGKEDFHSLRTGMLDGIIFLRQGSENRIRRMSAEEAVVSAFQSVFFSAETEQDVLLAADLIDRLLETVPVWELTNMGDEASAKLTYAELMGEDIHA